MDKAALNPKKSKSDMYAFMRDLLLEVLQEKPGLWANIRAKRARGGKPAHKNSKAHKDAVAAGKEINKNS